MGRRNTRRAVYDLEQDQLLKTGGGNPFAQDPLARTDKELDDDIRNLDDFRDAALHRDNSRHYIYTKYGTRQRRRDACLGLCTVLILLVVAAGVIYAVIESNRGSNESASQNGTAITTVAPTAAPDVIEPTLSPPIDTLAQLCQRDRITQEEFRPPCETQCAKAQCCTTGECNVTAPTACQEYADICQILQEYPNARPKGLSLEAPPSELRDVCQATNLQTYEGYQACAALCAAAACCNVPKSDAANTCIVESHQSCLDYHKYCALMESIEEPPTLGQDVTIDATNISLKLHAPPSYLDELCADEALETAQGRQACQDVCDTARCCNYPYNAPNQSCLWGNEDDCFRYHESCHLLDSPPVLKNGQYQLPTYERNEIREVCSPPKLKLGTPEGMQKCYDKCKEATCCYDTTKEGSCLYDPQCANFQDCFHLQTLRYVNEDMKDLIDTTCQNVESSVMQAELCHDVCAGAVCCFARANECPDQDDYSYCAQYQECGRLFFALNPNTPLALAAPDDEALSRVCSESNIEGTIGRLSCTELCLPSDCCSVSANEDQDSSSSCYTGNEVACSTYATYCSILDAPLADVVLPDPAPSNLEFLCNAASVDNDPQVCLDLCLPAICCSIPNTDPRTCAQETELCRPYLQYCNTLEPDLVPPVADIAAKCSESNVATVSGRRACERACNPAVCCQYPSNMEDLSCVAGNEHVCATYHAFCSVLDPNAKPLAEGEYTLPDNVALGDVYNACRAERLTTTANIQACHDICSQATCCYETGVGTCLEDERCRNFDLCFNYKALSYQSQDIPALIDSSCSDLTTQPGRDLCRDICEQSICCFAAGATCPDNDWSFCSQYDKCAFFFQDASGTFLGDGDGSTASTTILYPPPDSISMVCAESAIQTADGFNACQDLCSLADCCDYPSTLAVSCVAGNERVCATYHTYCYVLHENSTPLDPDEYELPDVDLADIQTACSPTALNTVENIQACSEICAEAECCFERGTASCLGDVKCVNFDLCFNYKALQYEHEDIPALIESQCTDTSEPEGTELCGAVCEHAACCFNDCPGEDLSYCDQYEKCAFLYGGDGGGSDGGEGFNGVTRQQVEAVCLSETQDLESCLDICEPGKCCWDSNESGCTGNPDCTVYDSCRDTLE